MEAQLRQMFDQAKQRLTAATTTAELEAARVAFLGRKGELTALLRGLGALPAEERPAMGALANKLRGELDALLESRGVALAATDHDARLQQEAIDVTLPGRAPRHGHQHPVQRVIEQINAIFVGMGFEVVEGPEVETQYYNFTALNYPEDHPAMDEQDCFYLAEGVLLRSHTSPMQIRVMQERQPPLRIITGGRTFRREVLTARHSHTFHQVEGFLVDRDVTFAHLKGILSVFAREMFGPKTEIRFRPDFFPFTEPSAEYAVTCFLCQGAGCRVCSGSGWLEIGGSGMVHPNVLREVGYDPEVYTGWAFGLGVDRITMLRYGLDDIRLVMESDMRFLRQF